jgi:hypothetical protein
VTVIGRQLVEGDGGVQEDTGVHRLCTRRSPPSFSHEYPAELGRCALPSLNLALSVYAAV